jgi:Ca2+:H+ antiporter
MKNLKNEKSLVVSIAAIVIAKLLVGKESVLQSDALSGIMFLFIFSIILSTAFSVVRHAEFLAHKFGEPYGTMILTFSAVTVEVIMVTAMMLHGDEDPTLARDTIFSTLMILIKGLIGIIMLIGGLKYGGQKYNLKSSNAFLSMILGLIGLGMLMPNLVDASYYQRFEIFIIIISVVLYAFFIRMQSKEQSYHFEYASVETGLRPASTKEGGQSTSALYHSTMLLLTIAAIAILAEFLSITVDDALFRLHLPPALGGVIVALIIVSPEGLTAIRAGLQDDMQRVINISLGSALSTISLTIPAVLIVGLITNKEINLGLTPVQSALVIISLLVGMLTTKEGETTPLQGFIHVVMFVTFVFMIFL